MGRGLVPRATTLAVLLALACDLPDPDDNPDAGFRVFDGGPECVVDEPLRTGCVDDAVSCDDVFEVIRQRVIGIDSALAIGCDEDADCAFGETQFGCDDPPLYLQNCPLAIVASNACIEEQAIADSITQVCSGCRPSAGCETEASCVPYRLVCDDHVCREVFP